MTFARDLHGADELKARFGDAVRRRRRDLSISQDELAVRSGLNRSYITEVETGKRNVALVNIWRLAHALETSVSALLAMAEREGAESRPLGESEVDG